MFRRVKYYKICYAIGLGILIILIGTRYTNKDCRCDQNRSLEYPDEGDKTDYLDKDLPTNFDGSPNIEKILDTTRVKIKTDLWQYNFSYSGVRKLEDLLIESGGTPIRNIIISSWRSGSTFLGELINAMPGNFYHYQPLLKYKIKQIRGTEDPDAEKALVELKRMFRCDFSAMEDYFEHGKNNLKYLNQFRFNRRLWDQCKYKKELCFEANFTSEFCKLFPFQSMKLVRLRLRLAKTLLQDAGLRVKVVLLIRDPRGVMQSRRYRNYCMPVADCSNPDLVCADMVSDYAAAKRLSREYPGRIMVLRFEDLALNLNATTMQLLKFLRLGATEPIHEYLMTHTNVEATEKQSTFRVTREVPFKWKKVSDFDFIDDIQESCKEAMALWGYKLAHNASHMKSRDFYPLESYSITQNNL